ncbi:MAG: serpin family protein [Candidatus Azobacteroides sp.]|nr:serpin family protein [Candidatus Azobacteroides sp.]
MKNLLTTLTLWCGFVLLFGACSDSDENLVIPDAKPISLRAGMEQKVVQDNDFAFDLFKTAYRFDTESNVFVSPLSVSMCLSMVLNGAYGETRTEIENALHISGFSSDEINDYCKTLREALLSVDPSTKIAIANSIWNRSGFPVKQDFLQINKINFNAEIKEVDFNHPNTVKQINNWCAENTQNKIPEILNNIPGDAIMYLINAVYFKGIWCSKFDKNATSDNDFYAGDHVLKVPMMNQNSDFNYFSGEDADYLELPYGNKAFSMITMLPHEGKTIDEVMSNLNNDNWNTALSGMRLANVNLRLPKFKTECEYKLHEYILPDMGMRIPFTDLADFSGISTMPVSISQVIHKTFVEVNEEGTEAAAVTAVEVVTTSIKPDPVTVNYIVDRPFIFAIREKSTRVILFIGKIEKP